MKKLFSFGMIFILLSTLVLAHVMYVVSEQDIADFGGADPLYFMRAMDATFYLIAFGTLFVLGALCFLIRSNALWIKKTTQINEKLKDYEQFVPWIARLGLGILLIGAGITSTLVSPTEPTGKFLATAEILIGFALLCGFLIGPITWIVIGFSSVSASHSVYFLANIVVIALALVIILNEQSKPGIDDILSIPFLLGLGKLKNLYPIVASIGLGISFAFLGIYEKLLKPHLAELVVTKFNLVSIIPVTPPLWVLGAGLTELGIGLLLIIRFQARLVAAISFIVLSASFFYFQEAVYSHIALFAMVSIIFITDGKKL